jgi:hypothetical protein
MGYSSESQYPWGNGVFLPWLQLSFVLRTEEDDDAEAPVAVASALIVCVRDAGAGGVGCVSFVDAVEWVKYFCSDWWKEGKKERRRSKKKKKKQKKIMPLVFVVMSLLLSLLQLRRSMSSSCRGKNLLRSVAAAAGAGVGSGGGVGVGVMQQLGGVAVVQEFLLSSWDQQCRVVGSVLGGGSRNRP